MSVLDRLNPLLWRACLAGDVSLIETTMSNGADPHVTDRNGENCLHMTARSGEVDAIERMTEEGLNIDTANHNGQTPLHVAINKNHLSIVRYIIRQGGSPDITTKFSGMTALHLACKDNNEDAVQFLLENGANCAITDKIQKYPDFYTSNKTILAHFDDHFVVCRHGRGPHDSKPGQQSAYLSMGFEMETDLSLIYNSGKRDTLLKKPQGSKKQQLVTAKTDDVPRDSSGTAVIDDGEEIEKAKSREKDPSKRMRQGSDTREDKGRSKQSFEDREHNGKPIYDKMEKYDDSRAKQNWNTLKKEQKKIKINHGMGFSDEHKQRMQTNVFDRLLGAKKK